MATIKIRNIVNKVLNMETKRERRYYYDEQKGWYIDYGEYIEVPQTLCKYYALSDNSVDALTNLYVYATHPNQLNDPFDCDVDLIQMDNTDDIRILLGNNPSLYAQFIDMCGGNEDTLKSIAPELFKVVFYRKCGVLSLCKSCESKQMWALYANNNGFCVEFDHTSFPFKHSGPFLMDYRETLETKSTSRLGGVPQAALYQTNVKTSEWAYEQEWRILISNPEGLDMKSYGESIYNINLGDEHDRKFRYPLCAIKNIYLGINFLGEDSCTISNNAEWEIMYQTECHQSKILDFLASTHIPTKFAVKARLNALDFIPIVVIKLNQQKYRLIATPLQ